VRSGLVDALGRGQVVPSITHSSRLSAGGVGSERMQSRRSRVASSEPSESASQVLDQQRCRRSWGQAQAYQRLWTGSAQNCLQQLKQAILPVAQCGRVELLAKVSEERDCLGVMIHAQSILLPGTQREVLVRLG